MKRSKYLLDFDIVLLQSIVFYIVLAILLLPHYQYQINQDGVSYISIAQKYILHDFHNAINGYWGPLLSWLLVPFLFAGFEPLLSVKLLSLIIGVMTIIQSNSLIKILKINKLLRNVLLYLISVIVIYFALLVITPDLLFVCLALAYINTILDSSYINGKYAGIISGIFGAGLYFTKSYGFPFFIVNFFIVNLIFYLRIKNKHNRDRILSNFISGIVVFFLISTCWISIISNKYGQLTIGTAGSYNHAKIGPQSLGSPIHYMGLLDPPNNTAISISEDPSYLKIQSWSIFNSVSSFKHQIKNILKNTYRIISILNEFSLLSLALLSMAVVYLLEKGKRIFTDNIFFLVVSLVVLFSGYALVLVTSRYIWLSNILILIIGAKLLDLLFQRTLFKQISKIILIVIFVVSFLVGPLICLYCNFDTGKDIFNLNSKISYLNINGRIASNGEWSKSLYLSFYNGWQYFGEKGKLTELELETELENKMINYFFVWKPSEEKINFVERYEEVTDGKMDEFRIYKLK
ncbi:MAG: hypothetical protein KAU01_05285 [Candidatus Cloacimonetes bacterium]|nr:hypothetical protein [Candidatus Cloacimonadota bacterium]